MGVALPSDLGGLQNSSVSQLNQDLLPVKLVGLAVVVWFDAANKVRLACHHLGQQVHQRVLERLRKLSTSLQERPLKFKFKYQQRENLTLK